MLRAALGRPALTGATALAIVSASTAAVAATTGAPPQTPLRTTASSAVSVSLVALGPTFSVRQGRPTSRVYDAVRRQIAADRRADIRRAARSAQRKALTSRNPKVVARAMLGRFGWGASQFSCLDQLWIRESKWSIHATNSSSGAYGIPQALPGSKMSSAGSDWRTSAFTQIRWGLGYIQDRYGSPCAAWGHSEGHGWY
ncbi:MAG: lytic transglycosylase domain-containing protein [Actinomycetota bacterium]|nr:lytic transglycosylase domain-containing protein [Actinomycetota bacterium]